MNIVIVGKGKWGTAIGSLLKNNQQNFSFWKRGEDLPNKSIIIICIPTQAIREVLKNHGSRIKTAVVINGAKGVEKKTHRLPYEIVFETLGENIDYFSLIGPSFAQEVVDKMPTLVNIGYFKKSKAELARQLLQTDYFRIRLSSDIRSLELASAFKNIYAIACGMAEGLGYETNTRVKLILIAMEELRILTSKLDFPKDENSLPGTVGDLILTCNSSESRNFSFGKLLVKNNSASALSRIGETVEGYSNAQSVPYFQKKIGKRLALAKFVYNALKRDDPKKLRNLFDDFVKYV